MSSNTADKDTNATDRDFPVVGIGASAGGLEAIKLFLGNVSEDPGMAYVFVQHLNPDRPSALVEILSRVSKISIEEVTNDVTLKKNHFYIVPQDKILTTVDGKLKLDNRNRNAKKINTIDLFFSSLGVVHQSLSVGVILSGTLDDGTLGLKVIKAYGGMTFVQDDTATHGGMPHNAIKSGAADFVLSPDKIALKLESINKNFTGIHSKTETIEKKTEEDDDVFKQLLLIIRRKKEVDFSYYKKSTVKRRIQRRMALNKIDTPTEYLNFIKENKTEQDALFNDMLISVTDFFRDVNIFKVLCDDVLPVLIDQKSSYDLIRVWVPGCATGEEAYSIAICIYEYMESKGLALKIQIFGTDLSASAIAKARTAIYSTSDLQSVSASRLQRFFTKTDGSNYQVNKFIRETCVFVRHNLLKDPPFSKMDIVSCRNVLIYMEPVLQKKALTVFHYSLKEKAILLLGKSETIGANTDQFTIFNKQEKIYIKKGTTGRFMHMASPDSEKAIQYKDRESSPVRNEQIATYKKAEEILLSQYTPPGVLVNEDLDIVQFYGSTDAWLSSSHGKPSFNLFKMAREGLSFELRNILHSVKTNKRAVKKDGIALKINDIRRYVTIEAMPLTDSIEPHYLVLFKNTDTYYDPAGQSNSQHNGENEKTDSLQARIEQLEKELSQNRLDMRIILEEQEATNEEFQSANEELLSGNEELQTLNEELETSKEELQSTNEELLSLNHELIDRNEQLDISRKFTEGVFETIRDPLIVLDDEFRITNATEGFYRKFELTEKETIGKVLFELRNAEWNIPDLQQFLESITEENSVLLNFEIRQTFHSIGKRILLMNGRQLQRIDGHKMILLAIEDVTDRKNVEQSIIVLNKLNQDLENSNFELEQFAAIASHDLQDPLRKIMTFVNIILDKKLEVSAQTQEYLNKISFSATRMNTIIKDLLSYSRVSSAEHSFVQTSLNTIIKNILSDLEITIHEKSAVVKADKLPTIDAIPLYINQLFYNLINNALKFVKKDVRPQIKIYSRILDADEVSRHHELIRSLSYIDIIVSDNGIGINPAHFEQIFGLFQRVNRGEFEGTGIGLALCRKIALQHHGKIYPESEEDKGTSFHVILPMRQ